MNSQLPVTHLHLLFMEQSCFVELLLSDVFVLNKKLKKNF